MLIQTRDQRSIRGLRGKAAWDGNLETSRRGPVTESRLVVVDTTVWVDYFRSVESAETDRLDAALDRERLGLTDLILCEILQGVRDDVRAKEVERQLRKLEVLEMCGADPARGAAANYRALRSRGHTVRKTVDCLIATFCIREDHSLLMPSMVSTRSSCSFRD